MKAITFPVLVAAMPFGLSAKKNADETFWTSFEKNQDDLYRFERDAETVFFSKDLHSWIKLTC